MWSVCSSSWERCESGAPNICCGLFAADGAVGAFKNAVSRGFYGVEQLQIALAFQNGFDELVKLAQTRAAGRAFAAALRVAQANEKPCKIHGAKPGLAGLDTPLRVFEQLVDCFLRRIGVYDTES